eukprot:1614604-Pyramimonas_sp.AAC.1
MFKSSFRFKTRRGRVHRVKHLLTGADRKMNHGNDNGGATPGGQFELAPIERSKYLVLAPRGTGRFRISESSSTRNVAVVERMRKCRSITNENVSNENIHARSPMRTS